MRTRFFLLLALLSVLLPSAPAMAQMAGAAAGGPVVVLTGPAAWTASPITAARTEAGGSIAVEGRVISPEEIVAVELDGSRAALRIEEDGLVWFSGFISPPPREGTIDVELRVRTALGDQRVIWLPVEVEPASDRSAEARMRDRLTYPERQRYAVVIGINDYPDPNIPDLAHAEADAAAFAEFLRSPAAGGGGVSSRNIHLLTGKDATARNVRGALSDVLHRATDRDVIYLFLVGQVGPEPDRLEPLYFYPYDAELSHLPGTGVEFAHIRDFLRSAGAHQVIVLADADRSGLIQQENRRGVFANIINDAFVRSLHVDRGGLFILTASEGSVPSREGTGWGGGHGIFTYALLQGMRGGADEDRDGLVTLNEIQRFVRRQVPSSTGGRQVPSVAPTSYDRFWPVSVVRRP